MWLRKLFKQPYKIVSYSIFFENSAYFPLQTSNATPWPINTNAMIFPEEKDVLVKKVRVSFINWLPVPSGNPYREWKVNFRFLLKTEVEKTNYQCQISNPVSGNFSVPPPSSQGYCTANNYKPVSDFQSGVIAGGIQPYYFEIQGWDNSTAAGRFIEMKVSVYYQDID